MPVPKGKEKLYGKIVGANINRGKSLEDAKDIADRAVSKKGRKPSASSKAAHKSVANGAAF